jgi:hypothetical protein
MPATIAAGSVFAANTVNILAPITSTSGTTVLTNISGTISWTVGGGSADMFRSVYDPDLDGTVENADYASDANNSSQWGGHSWPTDSSGCLYNDGSGNLSWTSCGGSGSPGGNSGDIQVNDGYGGFGGISNNSSNWDTAYGWGDHASAGYLTSQDGGTSDSYDDGTDTTIYFSNVHATSISTAYDIRLMEEVNLLPSVLDYISDIRPIIFKWNEKGLEQFPNPDEKEGDIWGFVAQDFETHFPQLLTSHGEYEQYNRNYLEAVMMKAIQELNDKIKEINLAINNNGSAGDGDTGVISPISLLEQFISLGIKIKGGVVWFKELAVEKITANEFVAEKITANIIRTDKIEMIDRVSGDVYCSWVEGGELKRVRGECSTIQFNNQGDSVQIPAVNPTPEPMPDVIITPTPEPTVGPTPQPTLTPTPTPQPSSMPEPTSTPAPTPEPTIEPTPNPTPEPTPEINPEPQQPEPEQPQIEQSQPQPEPEAGPASEPAPSE